MAEKTEFRLPITIALTERTKQTLKRIAAADGRALSNWINRHLEQYAEIMSSEKKEADNV